MLEVCPHCKRAGIRRTSRHGFAEKFVYSLFGYFPWWCTKCKTRSLLRERGEMSARRSRRRSQISDHDTLYSEPDSLYSEHDSQYSAHME